MLHISQCVSSRQTNWDLPHVSISFLSKVMGKNVYWPDDVIMCHNNVRILSITLSVHNTWCVRKRCHFFHMYPIHRARVAQGAKRMAKTFTASKTRNLFRHRVACESVFSYKRYLTIYVSHLVNQKWCHCSSVNTKLRGQWELSISIIGMRIPLIWHHFLPPFSPL